MELIPHFARKPLWGYRTAVVGLLGVTLLSWFVWQHHLFVSGIAPALRPFYMLSTEMISIPTGIVFLVAFGTLWRARISMTVPMLFCLGFLFNFLIGGLSGVFLSDVPSDVTLHGSYFSMAHFHFTIVGGEIFAIVAAIYYWFPKMTGRMLNTTLGKIHFWWMMIAFNLAFMPLFAAGILDMPRRVSTYAPIAADAERLGLDLGLPAVRLDALLRRQRHLVVVLQPQARRRPTRGTCARSSGSCRLRCRGATSSASRPSPEVPTTTATRRRDRWSTSGPEPAPA